MQQRGSASRDARTSRGRSRSRERGRRPGSGRDEDDAAAAAAIRAKILAQTAKVNPAAAEALSTQDAAAAAAVAAAASAAAAPPSQPFRQQQPWQGRDRDGPRRDGRPPYAGGGGGGRPPGGGGGGADRFGIPANDRVLFELHVGGIPDTIQSDEAFAEFLNDVCVRKNINKQPGNPIMSVRINPNGHFAFVTFRTKEEATAGLALHGERCLGSSLRVERPRGYQTRMAQMVPGLVPGAVNPAEEPQLIAASLAAAPSLKPIKGVSRDDLKRMLEDDKSKFGVPSLVLELQNLKFPETHPDAYTVKKAVETELAKYGTVVEVRASLRETDGIMVRMASLADSGRALDALAKRAMDGVAVAPRFVSEDKWR